MALCPGDSSTGLRSVGSARWRRIHGIRWEDHEVSVAVLLAACLLAAAPFGQVRSLPSTLTIQQTQEAIDWGMGTIKVDGKALNGNQQFQIAEYGYDAGAFLLTPYLKVAIAAQDAKRAGQPFGLAQAAVLLNDRLCDVLAFPYDRGPRWESEMDRFASVERVLLMPRTSEDPEKAIQPVRTKPLVNTSQTHAGLKRESITMIAGFPCEAVTVANDLIVTFAQTSGQSTVPQRKPIKDAALAKWR